MNERDEPHMSKRLRRETGQTMAEYAVMLGLISVGLVLALTNLGSTIGDEIARAASLIPG
jgi:Flp pilus assembly pilin Flp